jgi:hypothetical protein
VKVVLGSNSQRGKGGEIEGNFSLQQQVVVE